MSSIHQPLNTYFVSGPTSPALPNSLGSVPMQHSVSASSIETTASMQTTCTTPNMSPDMNVMSKIQPATVRSTSICGTSQNAEGRLKIQYLLTPGQSSTASFTDSAASTPEKDAAPFSPEQSMTYNVADPAVIPASNDTRNAELPPLFSYQSPRRLTYVNEDSQVLEAAHLLMALKHDSRMFALSRGSSHTQKQKAVHQRESLPALKPAHDPATRVTKKNNASASSNATKGKKIAPNVNGSNLHGNTSTSTAKKAPRAKSNDKNSDKAAQEGRNRTAAPSREDKDFESVLNFVPVVTLAPNQMLVYEEKANALDLSGDKLKHLLHSEELKLASALRLDCATYLTSKRRIFKRCYECILIGKVFRKTDAQKACNIDVNKASKLWTAFYEAGWFSEHLFSQYM
ncbi:swirm domain-containing protein [Ophiostoma piceae UAMH 11346]|uniref:Swirm domain-containing protein n=1 Tax=Ophiostoma piceae (strain UAMH 11346) TaxID=1262450 RepID=S3D118_OPHP1|nr:swirm domain-containing protein [Ophiostoma piceae UAMH 11346]